MSDSPITADKITEAYVKLRDQRSANKREFDANDTLLKDKMNKLEAWLLNKLREVGADSLKTEHGTAYISTRDRASCGDWGVLWGWLAENGRLDMLEKRVSTKPVTEYLEQYGELPPGVNIEREQTVIVRR